VELGIVSNMDRATYSTINHCLPHNGVHCTASTNPRAFHALDHYVFDKGNKINYLNISHTTYRPIIVIQKPVWITLPT